MSRNPHEPTAQTRKRVFTLAACGTPQSDIALLLDISEKTLRLYYRMELDEGTTDMIAAVIGTLLKMINAGNRSAAIFYNKCWGGQKPHAKELAERAVLTIKRDEADKIAREKQAERDFQYITGGCDAAKCIRATDSWIEYSTGFGSNFTREAWSTYIKKFLQLMKKVERDAAVSEKN